MALGSVFLSTLLLSFGSTLFLAGLFGAYFGEGRSRSIGFVISLVAVLFVGLFAAMTWPIIPGVETVFSAKVVGQSMVAVLAATVGSLIAIATFVAGIMQS